MASRRKIAEPTIGTPTVEAAQGIVLIDRLLADANALLGQPAVTADELSRWDLLAENLLAKVFGSNSPNVTAVRDAGGFGAFSLRSTERDFERHRRTQLTSKIAALDGLRELLTTEIQLQEVGVAELSQAKAVAPPKHTVFLVHGHDERYLHEAARLLERLGLKTIVLREQASRGYTIVEKFEAFSDVGFAVVLLTGDDRGGTSSAPWEEQKPRARQNVVFELGYFIGRLGRQRVCVLYESGVEIPSDYSGVLYVPLDASSVWRLLVAKELSAAGFSVDLNDAI